MVGYDLYEHRAYRYGQSNIVVYPVWLTEQVTAF